MIQLKSFIVFYCSTVIGFSSFAFGDSCGTLPPKVKEAYDEAVAYKKKCMGNITTNADDKFIINDYSEDGTAKMYAFRGENCLLETPVSWGAGKGGEAASSPKACDEAETHLSAPGFFMTVPHTGGSSYNQNDSIGLASMTGKSKLSERGLLIHATENPGTACTWGCAGVSQSSFQKLHSEFQKGALVYNYFGNKTDCSGASVKKDYPCSPEDQARKVAAELAGRGVLIPSGTRSSPGGSSQSGSR